MKTALDEALAMVAGVETSDRGDAAIVHLGTTHAVAVD